MPKLRCSVEDCYYWKRGNYCEADEVEVRENLAAPRLEMGVFRRGRAGKVGSSRDTQCGTFRPR